MVQFIFLHDEYKTLFFEQDLYYESINEYRDWFIETYPCLYEWKNSMEWTMQYKKEENKEEQDDKEQEENKEEQDDKEQEENKEIKEKKEKKDNETIQICFETKLEGYTTLCIRNTENNLTLNLPFPDNMNYYQLQTIFSLLLPKVEVVFYLKHGETYYMPKHPYVFVPKNSKDCMVNINTYPVVIYMNYTITTVTG